jgi:outer membrane protein assembly factor BamB
MRDLVYIGIRGHALALDRANGREVWKTQLKGADFVNVALHGDDVLASSRGELFCLDGSSGKIRWHNKLSGLGWGLVSIAGTGAVTAAETRRRQQARQAAS